LGEKDLTFLDNILVRTKSYTEKINSAVTRELQRYEDSRFYGPLVYALEGGKRVRPLIALLSTECVGGDEGKALDAAVAVELLHAESIIHDDIIDQEVSRRGKAAFHIRYGYSASLLTADFVFAMILAIAARYQDRKVANTLSNAALHMCEGEYAEITIDPDVYRLGWDEYTDLVFDKTASLFQTAGRLGALVGGGGNEEVEALSNYGKYVGIAYQVHDDMLDWGSKDKITSALEDKDGDTVLPQLKRLSEIYAKKAKEQLAVLRQSNAKSLLLELTDFSIQRSS
jgi:octaprenyl-diphosphate synthase